MRNLLLLGVVFCFAAALYALRGRILRALKRFDERNAARRRDEILARFQADAHYKQTLALADEEVEPITAFERPDARTGVMTARFVFMGEEFATRAEAETARNLVVAGKARAFYQDLDRQWLGPGPSQRSRAEAGALPAPGSTPPRP